MNSSEISTTESKTTSGKVFDIVIRLTALALLLYWSFKILQPFIGIMLWAVIFAVALYPVFTAFSKRMKKAWAATLISLIVLAVIVAPAVWLMISTAGDVVALKQKVSEQGVTINPPPPQVKDIPVIGRKLDQAWTQASVNFAGFAQEHKDAIKNTVLRLFALISSGFKGILLLIGAIIVSGVLMYYGRQAGNFARSFFIRLAGKGGENMASIAEVTIRNVTRGILGVAVIQSLLAGIGMVIGGVPLAGLWTLLCLILAIVQVPILPVAIGVIIYLWSSDTSTVMAVILTIWMLVVGLLDNVLKPILLGKGAPVPMLVVFLGAIGGFIVTGFTGLFTGAIILSLAYKIFEEWMNSGKVATEEM